MTRETVQELFDRQAAANGDRLAIAWAEHRTASYAALRDRARRLGGALMQAGAARGSLVGVLSRDPIETIAAILGTLYAGAAFVPFDPALPLPRVKAMLRVAAPELFLIDAACCESVSEALPTGHAARALLLDGPASRSTTASLTILDQPSTHPVDPLPVAGDDLCYVYFTSGSTGQPKGIAGRTKGITHFCEWERRTFGIDAETHVSQLVTPSYDAFLRDVFTPLIAGGTICIPPVREIVSDPARLVQWIEHAHVHVLHTVPSVFRGLLNEAPPPERLASLRAVLLAGEPLLPADVRRWMAIVGDRVRLVNLYGPSETTMTKFWYEVRAADMERATIPIGAPMDGARALICDVEGRPCGIGTLGEIYIRTPFRSLGYYRRPDLTRAAFVPNPLTQDPNDLVYKTGDLGRMLDDGTFELLGRRDRQVKIRGVRVELAEVENALRLHDSVRDVAVIDRDDPDGARSLCAYVVLHPIIPLDDLRRHLADHVPAAMIPSAYMAVETLPRTTSGKLDRAALPLTADVSSTRAVPFVAPRTPTEEALAAIWRELMQITTPSIHHDFFTVGGHSLLAMQVISRVEAAFGVTLPLETFLGNPTIHALAHYIESAMLEQAEGADELLNLLDLPEGG